MASYFIDKSRFSDEQLAVYEELVAIGKAEVDPAAAKPVVEDDAPAATDPNPTKKAEVEPMETKKSAAPVEPEVPQFVKDAIAKSEAFIEEQRKREMADVAKKYAVLVESVDDLADQLYTLKKSNPDMYATCIAMMDKQAALVEKSGLFAEVGKSGAGFTAAGGSEAKAEAKAQEIMKADPSIDYNTAIAKAYEDPAIMAECDAEYYGRR